MWGQIYRYQQNMDGMLFGYLKTTTQIMILLHFKKETIRQK